VGFVRGGTAFEKENHEDNRRRETDNDAGGPCHAGFGSGADASSGFARRGTAAAGGVVADVIRVVDALVVGFHGFVVVGPAGSFAPVVYVF